MIKVIQILEIDAAGFVCNTDGMTFAKNGPSGESLQDRKKAVQNRLNAELKMPRGRAVISWVYDGQSEGYYKESR